MKTNELKTAFAEVSELRQQAQEKEEKIVEQLVSDGELTVAQAMLIKGPKSPTSLTELLTMAMLSKTKSEELQR